MDTWTRDPRSEGAPTCQSIGFPGGGVNSLALSACPMWAKWSVEGGGKSLHAKRSRYWQLEVDPSRLEGPRAVATAMMTSDAK